MYSDLSFAEFLFVIACAVKFEDIVINFLSGSESDADVAVSAAVIQSDSAGVSVLKSSTGEAHVWHEASFLIPFLRSKHIAAAAVKHS